MHFKCSLCGVGINNGEETFTEDKTEVYCKYCTNNFVNKWQLVADCFEKIQNTLSQMNININIDENIRRLKL